MKTPAPTRRSVTTDRSRFYELSRSRWLRPVPDGLRRLAAHASAADLLRRSDGALAAGAAIVAAVVALRLAATPSETGAESTAKWDAIRATTPLLRSAVTDRLGRLCDMAVGFEAGQLRLADTSAQSRERVMDAPSTGSGHGSGPIALGLYADVLWLRGRPDAVSDLTTEVEADARELGRRRLAHAMEGAEAHLCDVALALCAGASASAPGAVADVLDSLRPAARNRPVVLAVIDFTLAET